MMGPESETPVEIRDRGLQALVEELGPVGMTNFLRQYNKGSGDYTEDRKEWLENDSVDDIAKISNSKEK